MWRVGHDISSYWRSAISLVDIGSSLWPFIHNGSRCNDSTHVAGWRPDLDMLEVGASVVAVHLDIHARQIKFLATPRRLLTVHV
jgi:hypothetical protein